VTARVANYDTAMLAIIIGMFSAKAVKRQESKKEQNED